jgi:UDP-N-acetyl-D-glucosamine dehydrogenase
MSDINFSSFFENTVKNVSDTRPVVCIQGLGFVGAAMCAAVSMAVDAKDNPVFNVIGVDLPNFKGMKAITSLNNGEFPAKTTDANLEKAISNAHTNGNLVATTDPSAYSIADIIIVDIHLDLQYDDNNPIVKFESLEKAIETIASHMKAGTLIIIELTLPPGTCKNVIAPTIEKVLLQRGLNENAYLLAHSYERVMPSANYLDSIINYWRVYSGYTQEAADSCERFLEKIVNTQEYPLTRLSNTTASETAKVLENSYRATNIAFIEEWGRFAEAVNIDLYEIVEAIRIRPTHSNIRTPGFGVGGYCLTKDPLFAMVAAKTFWERDDLDFPFCRMGIQTNKNMPLVTLSKLEISLGSLQGKNLLLLGVSYRNEVDDTRYSPSETFYRAAISKGANVSVHDPLVKDWVEMDMTVPDSIPPAEKFHAVIFAVAHNDYIEFDVEDWLGNSRPLIFDANNVLGVACLNELKEIGCQVDSIGRDLSEEEI